MSDFDTVALRPGVLMHSPPIGNPVRNASTWKVEYEQLARELSSWIPQPDVRDHILSTVRKRFEIEKKSVGDLKRWLKRALQNTFFVERLAGNAWSDEHQQFAQWCTTWITDIGTREEVIGLLRVRFEGLKTNPKNPSYWIRRTTAARFRSICRQHGIPPANQWNDDVWELARLLANNQNIPEDIRDSVISEVWKRFVAEVEPIENLTHWMNKVISTAYSTEIRDATGSRSGVQWQLLTQTKGTKGDVEKELAHLYEREKETGKDESAADSGLSPEDLILIQEVRRIHASEGKTGKLSGDIIDWHFEEGYEHSEIAEFFGLPVEKIVIVQEHDLKRYCEIATQKGGRETS